MASNEDVKVLEGSTKKRPTTSTSKFGSSGRIVIVKKVLMESPAVPDASDESRVGGGECPQNPSSKLLSGFQPRYSDDKASVDTDQQSDVSEDSEGMVEDMNACYCGSFMESYKRWAINFRSSRLMCFVQFLFAFIPVSAVIMGCKFIHECPLCSRLPIYFIVEGILSTILLGAWMASSFCQHWELFRTNQRKCFIGICCVSLIVLIGLEIHVVGIISPSFDPSSLNYCNEELYNYAIYKQVASAIAFVIAALFYLPGCQLLDFCHNNCPVPQPAGAFFPIP